LERTDERSVREKNEGGETKEEIVQARRESRCNGKEGGSRLRGKGWKSRKRQAAEKFREVWFNKRESKEESRRRASLQSSDRPRLSSRNLHLLRLEAVIEHFKLSLIFSKVCETEVVPGWV
jgi:hypothetical protein